MLQLSSFSTFRILGLSVLFLVSACQQKSEAPFDNRPSAPATQSAPAEKPADLESAPDASGKKLDQFQDAAANGDIFSSAAAVPSAIDSLKKFVRTAEMRFRVSNTAASTLRIEDIALRNGGFILSSNLNTAVEFRRTTPVSRDSAVETTRYTIHSQLVIRVPYRLLDTTLRSIGRLSDFLDLRRVSAEDVGLQMLEKELARLREGIYRTDLAHSEESKYNPKADRARDSRAATDQARIETLKLEDEIRFSTVMVDIYQHPQILQTMVANTAAPMPQEPFAARLMNALRTGGEVLVMIFIGIVHLWGLILLLVLGYFTWKFLGKKRAEKTRSQATPQPN